MQVRFISVSLSRSLSVSLFISLTVPCLHVRMHNCMCLYLCMYVCVCVFTHVCIYASMCLRIYDRPIFVSDCDYVWSYCTSEADYLRGPLAKKIPCISGNSLSNP